LLDDKVVVSKELATFYRYKEKLKHTSSIMGQSKINITPSYGKKKMPNQDDNLIETILEMNKEQLKSKLESSQERNSVLPQNNFKRFTHDIL
jgi:hypothetical protein